MFKLNVIKLQMYMFLSFSFLFLFCQHTTKKKRRPYTSNYCAATPRSLPVTPAFLEPLREEVRSQYY